MCVCVCKITVHIIQRINFMKCKFLQISWMTSHIMQIYAELFLEFDCGPKKKREFMQQYLSHLLIYACMDELRHR